MVLVVVMEVVKVMVILIVVVKILMQVMVKMATVRAIYSMYTSGRVFTLELNFVLKRSFITFVFPTFSANLMAKERERKQFSAPARLVARTGYKRQLLHCLTI